MSFSIKKLRHFFSVVSVKAFLADINRCRPVYVLDGDLFNAYMVARSEKFGVRVSCMRRATNSQPFCMQNTYFSMIIRQSYGRPVKVTNRVIWEGCGQLGGKLLQ